MPDSVAELQKEIYRLRECIRGVLDLPELRGQPPVRADARGTLEWALRPRVQCACSMWTENLSGSDRRPDGHHRACPEAPR